MLKSMNIQEIERRIKLGHVGLTLNLDKDMY